MEKFELPGVANLYFNEQICGREHAPECYDIIHFLSLRRSVIVGAGYIAVELAGILSALGSKTSLLIRYNEVRGTCLFTFLSDNWKYYQFLLELTSTCRIQPCKKAESVYLCPYLHQEWIINNCTIFLCFFTICRPLKCLLLFLKYW